jgi:mRNA interferase RelE/StbE
VVGLRLDFGVLAKKQFYELDPDLQAKIIERLQWFLGNNVLPDPLEGNFKGLFKLRVGDYRIIYRFESEKTMLVRAIGHRSRVYKDLVRLLDS